MLSLLTFKVKYLYNYSKFNGVGFIMMTKIFILRLILPEDIIRSFITYDLNIYYFRMNIDIPIK